MLDGVTAASFQEVAEPDKVGANVGLRVFQAIAYPCLGGHIEHVAETLFLKKTEKGAFLRQIKPDKAEEWFAFKAGDAGAFKGRVVVVIEVVNAHNLMPGPRKGGGKVKAYEAGRAGNKHSHENSFL